MEDFSDRIASSLVKEVAGEIWNFSEDFVNRLIDEELHISPDEIVTNSLEAIATRGAEKSNTEVPGGVDYNVMEPDHLEFSLVREVSEAYRQGHKVVLESEESPSLPRSNDYAASESGQSDESEGKKS